MLVGSENGAFEVKYNFYTLYIYEQEFGTDLIKDLYGSVAVESDGYGMAFSFNSVNWTSVTKALWAGAKCANPSTPRFAEWAQTASFDLLEASGIVIEEINKELFRFGVAPVS